MDPAWQNVLIEKNYLFPDRWPLDAWLVCAVYVAVILFAAARRRQRDELTIRERGVLAGAATLLGLFIIAVPLLVARSALAIQLQPARIFWLFDLLATVAIIWVAESTARIGPKLVAALTIVLLVASAARGLYLMQVRFPERAMFRAAPADSPWQEVMRFAQATDPRSHWLAHPNHAFLYGSSLRVSGRRDVFVEATKDPAVAMYDRRVAMRVAERLPLVSNFDGLTIDGVAALARRYELDFMVTEQTLPLAIAFSRPPLFVYDVSSLRRAGRGLH
jgi:hypothetical protein